MNTYKTRNWLIATIGAGILTASTATAALAISKDDIIALAAYGEISADEIIEAINKDRTVFNLTVTEILELKKANVPEEVIKHMLQTPNLFGSTGAAVESTRPEEPVETEEERAAREARMKAEAEALLRERAAAEAAQQQAYAEGVFAQGRALADKGQWPQAIQTFQNFDASGNYEADSQEAYFARFGTAYAFANAGLLQSAAAQLVQLVLEGPRRPFFQTSFTQLRELRQKVDYAPPELERLADFAGEISQFSQRFQDEFNYVLGEFFHEGQDWSRAVSFLDAVSRDAPDFAKAQYLKGVVEVENELYRSAVQSFQEAILATERNNSAHEISELSYLALARIAYNIGDYDASIYYYRKIPTKSYKTADAFYESSWVYFLKGDYSRALGTFHTLDSPYFEHYFYPEMWILEATAYLNLCHFDKTSLALQRFEQEILPLIPPIEGILNRTQRPEDFYTLVLDSVKEANQGRSDVLPRPVLSKILSNVEFYNLYQTIRQIESEIPRLRTEGKVLGEYADSVAANLVSLRHDRIQELGFTIRLILTETLNELQDFRTKHIELGIDMEGIAIDEIDRRQRQLNMGEVEEESESVEKGGSGVIIGSDTWRWDFDNEYWADEIGSYRSLIDDQCANED